MLSYCLKCRKNTENKNPKCEVCHSQKSKFIKQQEAIGLISSFRIKAPLSKINLVGPLLF